MCRLFGSSDEENKVISLCPNFRLYLCNTYKKDISEFQTDVRFISAISLLDKTFSENNKSSIKDCMHNGLSLILYRNDDKNELKVVSAVNFVISSNGAYVNWMTNATTCLFNQKAWYAGDDKSFTN